MTTEYFISFFLFLFILLKILAKYYIYYNRMNGMKSLYDINYFFFFCSISLSKSVPIFIIIEWSEWKVSATWNQNYFFSLLFDYSNKFWFKYSAPIEWIEWKVYVNRIFNSFFPLFAYSIEIWRMYF